ncbi:non-ribosomal peptide synthetase [Kineosporia succinea]|uniref:Amino acid adenylation domain-containing protein n=1 Tax=Kineosporia succinea TaxID=84632 RepID=A0ABT9PCT2_9ACTN|nr:non-ribosomal peptide synthetase [Kineosporia succinea]MDP9830204.1 amino acid adenylation domain-containing protein [Kineosporia succinea]
MIDLLPPTGPLTTADAFARVAEAVPTRPAVRHAGTELTYEELAQRAGGIADELRSHGVGRGDVVATLLERSPEAVVAVLATWAVGAAYVHLEPTDPQARVAVLLAAVRPAAVLTDARNRDRADGDWLVRDLGDRPPLAPYRISDGLGGADPAYLVLTSGSTGTPKTVEVPHHALINYCAGYFGLAAELGDIGSYGVATTFAADIGKASIYGALLSGARLDIYDRETTLDPLRLAGELAQHPVDVVTFTPSLLETLASAGELSGLLPRRLVIFIGEALPPRLVRAIFTAAPTIEIYNGYGPAEATIVATVHRVEASDGHAERVPIGYPLPRIRTVVLDEEDRPVADGTTGVLHLGGQCLATGYRGDPVKTAEKFVTVGGERLYRTDDLVIRSPEGRFDYLGRADDQLKIRGNRVEPGEVETALLGVPGVRLATVRGERAEPGASPELAAYVVGTASSSDIVAWLLERLPAALIPSRLHLVPYIPVTMNGKADYGALRELVAGEASGPPAGEEPVGEVEEFVAQIWCEVLGSSRVGRHDRFVESGGTSFKAVAVFGRLRRRFPDFTLADLYAHPTVADLAVRLGGGPEGRPAPVVVDL